MANADVRWERDALVELTAVTVRGSVIVPSPSSSDVASNFLQILSQLHDHHVEFVIVGGVAATLHGGSRVTFDLDLVPRMTPPSWTAAVDLLWSLGARPRIPESRQRIRDLENVRRWQQEKGMLALNFRSPDGDVEVDLLVSESDRFDDLRSRAVEATLEDRTFHVASIEDLIAMKRKAGGPQDLLDIAHLEDVKRRLQCSGCASERLRRKRLPIGAGVRVTDHAT